MLESSPRVGNEFPHKSTEFSVAPLSSVPQVDLNCEVPKFVSAIVMQSCTPYYVVKFLRLPNTLSSSKTISPPMDSVRQPHHSNNFFILPNFASHSRLSNNELPSLQLAPPPFLLNFWRIGMQEIRSWRVSSSSERPPNRYTPTKEVLLLPHTCSLKASTHHTDKIFPALSNLDKLHGKWSSSCWPTCEEPSCLDSDGRPVFHNQANKHIIRSADLCRLWVRLYCPRSVQSPHLLAGDWSCGILPWRWWLGSALRSAILFPSSLLASSEWYSG